MMFLNTWEIDNARDRYASDPILGPATRSLANLRDAANANSDGWAYWPKPARAAKSLQELIQRADARERARYTGAFESLPEVTAADVRRALRPVKAFRTRSGIPFDIETV